MEETILTVIIITYNHSKYIKNAIDSVLSQITSYRYEIVIHDDCSTDGTTDILREYKKEYPERIELILEESNKKGKGQDLLVQAMRPFCKRKYIIFLEGDDYWCDNQKIQKQLDYLEKHSNVIGVTHRSKNVITNDFGEKRWLKSTPDLRTKDAWDIGEAIDWLNTAQSTTLMFRTEYWNSMPKNLSVIQAYDWARFVWLCAHGQVHHSNEEMSVHRCYTENSFSHIYFGKESFVQREQLLAKRQEWCELLDEDTGYAYHRLFIDSQERRWGEYFWDKGEYKAASRYKGFVKRQPFRKKMIMRCIAFVPGFSSLYQIIIGNPDRS